MSFANLKKGFPFLYRFSGLVKIKPVSIFEYSLKKKKSYKEFKVREFFYSDSDKIPVIFLLHGMSAYGIDDPRIYDLATNLSYSGYRVICPELEEVKSLKILADTIENIQTLYHLILEKYRNRKMGYFSVSFSAGMGLTALAKENIPVMMLVGGFYNIMNISGFVVSNFNKDDYGTYVLFYNFIDKIEKKYIHLKEYFYEAALDNGLRRKNKSPKAPRIYQKLKPSEKDFLNRIESSSELRKEIAEQISDLVREPSKRISPEYVIDSIQAKLSILHGKNDYVIPESESILLSNSLKSSQKEHNLEITGLLDHGDKVSYVSKVHEIPALSKSFGYFFNNL
jgi:hypothetical protein